LLKGKGSQTVDIKHRA